MRTETTNVLLFAIVLLLAAPYLKDIDPISWLLIPLVFLTDLVPIPILILGVLVILVYVNRYRISDFLTRLSSR